MKIISYYDRLRIGVLVQPQSWNGTAVGRRKTEIAFQIRYLPASVREFFHSKYLSVFSNAIPIENYFIFFLLVCPMRGYTVSK